VQATLRQGAVPPYRWVVEEIAHQFFTDLCSPHVEPVPWLLLTQVDRRHSNLQAALLGHPGHLRVILCVLYRDLGQHDQERIEFEKEVQDELFRDRTAIYQQNTRLTPSHWLCWWVDRRCSGPRWWQYLQPGAVDYGRSPQSGRLDGHVFGPF